MSEAWYEGLPDDAFVTETDKAYEKAEAAIREGLAQGFDFDSACAAVDIEDDELKKAIIDDMLKVLIAEDHFTQRIPLDEMAKKYKIAVGSLEAAKAHMLEDVKKESVKEFYKSLGSGNA